MEPILAAVGSGTEVYVIGAVGFDLAVLAVVVAVAGGVPVVRSGYGLTVICVCDLEVVCSLEL